jgi:putative ABC transport system substrate-binding protein
MSASVERTWPAPLITSANDPNQTLTQSGLACPTKLKRYYSSGVWDEMRRREFIWTVGVAVAWPLAARAQQGERMRRVNVLLTTTGGEGQARDAAFRAGLDRRGWIDGRNVQISTRFIDPADGLETAQLIAKEFVALRPDAILVQSTPHTAAMQRQTGSVPIVFVGVSDPVGAGFAESLRRPGGNLTGLVLFESSVTGKWIGMLKEIAPRLQRVALLLIPMLRPIGCVLRRASRLRSRSNLLPLRSRMPRT